MRINLRQNQEEHFKTDNKLWQDSPCTLQYVCQNTPIDRTERFNIGSIYYKDEVNKQKKVFTQFEKPQLLLQNFRRQIDEASNNSLTKRKFKSQSENKSKSKNNNNKNKQNYNSNSNSKQTNNNNKYASGSGYNQNQNIRSLKCSNIISNHIYNVPQKLQMKHDKFGNRSNYTGQYDVKDIMERFRSTRNNFTSSTRIDLALPLNFYPGPGSYFNDDDSKQSHLKGEKSQTHRHISSVRKSSTHASINRNESGHENANINANININIKTSKNSSNNIKMNSARLEGGVHDQVLSHKQSKRQQKISNIQNQEA